MNIKEDRSNQKKTKNGKSYNFILTKRQRILICYLLHALNITPEQIIYFIKRTYQDGHKMNEDSIKKNIIRLKEYSFKYESTVQYNYFDLFNKFFQNYFKYSKYNNIKDDMIRNVSQQISTIYSSDIFTDETVEKKFIDKSIDCIYQILYPKGNTFTLYPSNRQFTDPPKYFYLVYYLCMVDEKNRNNFDGQPTDSVGHIKNMWQFLYDLLPEEMESIMKLQYYKNCMEIINMPYEKYCVFINTEETLFALYKKGIFSIDKFNQTIFKNIIDFQKAATNSSFQKHMQEIVFNKQESFTASYNAVHKISNFQRIAKKYFSEFLSYKGSNNDECATIDCNHVPRLTHAMVMMSNAGPEYQQYFESFYYLFNLDEFMHCGYNTKLEILKNYYLLHLLNKEKLLINRMKGRTTRKKKEEKDNQPEE